jgi:iron complex outermembrane receptor protein
MRMDMPGSSNTLGMYAEITRNWAEKHRLTLKIDNYTNVSLAEMTMFMRYPSKKPEAPMYMQTWPEMLRNVTGVYFQNTSFFTPSFSLNINARMDFNTDILRSEYGERQFSVFGYTLPKKQESTVKSFNISAEYQISEKLNLLLSGGYAERLPIIGERFGFYLYNAYDGYDYIGTPDLKVEKGKNLRFSAQYTSEKLKFSFSQSANFVKDYILGITDSAIPPLNFYARGTRRYSNIASATIHASDFSLFYFPSKTMTIFSVTKFTYGKINKETALPLIPPLKNFLALKFEKKNFFLQAECENALAQNRINAEYGEKKTPGFTVFHLKTGYTLHFSEKQLFFGVNVSNLTNRTYYEHLDWGKIYRPGRNFEIFCQFTW